MRWALIGLFVSGLAVAPADLVLAQTTDAQPAVATSTAPSQPTLTAGQLDALVAPIALYPDQLLSNVLMASTYPIEIVDADRWLHADKGLTGVALSSALDQQSWHASVKALVWTPQVLDMMNTQLDWTQKLGNAVMAQQADVMAAVQSLRAKAEAEKKLETTKEQIVSTQTQGPKQVIVIEPADPGTLYVPYYNPAVVYGTWGWPAYPPYYWPPPAGYAVGVGITFGVGIAVGDAWWGWGHWGGGGYWGGFDWWHGNINVHQTVNINNNIHVNSDNWQRNVNDTSANFDRNNVNNNVDRNTDINRDTTNNFTDNSRQDFNNDFRGDDSGNSVRDDGGDNSYRADDGDDFRGNGGGGDWRGNDFGGDGFHGDGGDRGWGGGDRGWGGGGGGGGRRR